MDEIGVKQLVSPKELACAIGVSESSMKRWADEGLVQASRTVGGHRRIALPEAVRFIRQIGATVVRPELLGLHDLSNLPPSDGSEQRATSLYTALERGDQVVSRGLIQSMYLSGMTVAEIGDGPLREAMVRIGELWLHQEWGIAVEHRATDICIQAVNQLRLLQPIPAEDAPVAVGGAGADDPYILPSLLCAAVAAESGYRDVNLGPRTPVSVLRNAALHYNASVVWAAVSITPSAENTTADLRQLARDLHTRQCPVIAGGRAIAQSSPADLAGIDTSHSMVQFSSILRAIKSRTEAAQPPLPPRQHPTL